MLTVKLTPKKVIDRQHELKNYKSRKILLLGKKSRGILKYSQTHTNTDSQIQTNFMSKPSTSFQPYKLTLIASVIEFRSI